jgi:hypothetical protein
MKIAIEKYFFHDLKVIEMLFVVVFKCSELTIRSFSLW